MTTLLLLLALVQQEQPAPRKLATLEGNVLNAVTGTPIRRATLTLRVRLAAPSGLPPTPLSATTNAEGKFRIERVEPGVYHLEATRQGFVLQQYNARTPNAASTPITVSESIEIKELNFKLIPHAVLAGRVIDDEAEPIANIQIEVLRQTRGKGNKILSYANRTQTNDLGEFRAANLPPGRYWLKASELVRGQIYGEGPPRVNDDTPEEELVPTYFPSSTDESGARPVEVAVGQTLSSIDIRMRRERTYLIRGRVVAPPPVKDIRVVLIPHQPGKYFNIFGDVKSGSVKSDGAFEISKVLPGEYEIAAFTLLGNIRALGRTSVNLARENLSGVVVPLFSPVTVSGSIRVAVPDEIKVVNFSATRIFLESNLDYYTNSVNASISDDQTFKLENAFPERYRVLVGNLPAGHWIQAINSGGQDVLESGIDLTAGATEPIEIVIGTGVGTVTGIVNDTKDKPVPGLIVQLVEEPIKLNRYDRHLSTTTDQHGQFKFENIKPGDYRAFAWENLDTSGAFDPELAKANESLGKRLTIKQGSSEQLTLKSIAISEK